MEGLRYLVTQIETLRYLLHGFISDTNFLTEVISSGIELPGQSGYINDGSIEFQKSPRSTSSDPTRPGYMIGFAHPFPDLTLEELKTYLSDFYDDTRRTIIVMPIEPLKRPPSGYNVELKLVYLLGGGLYGAYLRAGLISLNTEREFRVQICHDYLPQNYESLPDYKTYKRTTRRRSDLHGSGATIQPYRIQIDEKTIVNSINIQLLLYAWTEKFISEPEGEEFFQELGTLIRPRLWKRYSKDNLPTDEKELLAYLIEHFWKKRLFTFSPQSFEAYLQYLLKGFTIKVQKGNSGGAVESGRQYEVGNDGDNMLSRDVTDDEGERVIDSPDILRGIRLHGRVGSVPYAFQETGISEGTIYRKIRQGKIRATKEHGIIKLEPDIISELKRLGAEKKTRRAIIKLAKKKGESKEAVKKRLWRYRDVPEDIRNERLRRWLAGG